MADGCLRAAVDVEQVAARQRMIADVCNPLPGAAPYANRRPVNIPGAYDGWMLLDVLVEIMPHIPREEWARRCDEGRFMSGAGVVRAKDHRVRGGERVVQDFASASEPPVATDISLIYEDEALIVVGKPAPLPMHPSGRFNRNTLQHILNLAYAPDRLLPVHRLDANTTGLVILARTRNACRLLQQQFLSGTVDKRYLVRVAGHPAEDCFAVTVAISQAPGILGSHAIDESGGRASRTDFTVIGRHADGTAMLEARLVTGRTNQIRVHLWHLGHPVIGDPAYLAGGAIGDTQTLATQAPPLHLHAWRLAFQHPLRGEPMAFEADPPTGFSAHDQVPDPSHQKGESEAEG